MENKPIEVPLFKVEYKGPAGARYNFGVAVVEAENRAAAELEANKVVPFDATVTTITELIGGQRG